jgi:hypothetical protein
MHLFGVGGNGAVYEQKLDGYGNPITAWLATAPGYIASNNVTVGRDPLWSLRRATS